MFLLSPFKECESHTPTPPPSEILDSHYQADRAENKKYRAASNAYFIHIWYVAVKSGKLFLKERLEQGLELRHFTTMF